MSLFIPLVCHRPLANVTPGSNARDEPSGSFSFVRANRHLRATTTSLPTVHDVVVKSLHHLKTASFLGFCLHGYGCASYLSATRQCPFPTQGQPGTSSNGTKPFLAASSSAPRTSPPSNLLWHGPTAIQLDSRSLSSSPVPLSLITAPYDPMGPFFCQAAPTPRAEAPVPAAPSDRPAVLSHVLTCWQPRALSFGPYKRGWRLQGWGLVFPGDKKRRERGKEQSFLVFCPCSFS